MQAENGELNGRQVPAGEFTGLVSLQLADLIQMVCLSRWDLIVRVSSAQGRGTIQIREGRIDHAQTDTLQGDQAFFEMFRWTDGQFEMLPYKATELNSMGKPWEHLLLEAMRQRDEALSKKAGLARDDLEGDEELAQPDCSGLEGGFEAFGFGAELPAVCPTATFDSGPASEPHAGSRLKALVVEDSPFFARQLQKTLEGDGDIEVVAIAKNGQEALDILSSTAQVDVVTLDVEMPVMPGGTALKHIMIRHRVPALVISAFQPNAMGQIFEYMELGAVDFISKPGAGDNIENFGRQLRGLARKASSAELAHFRRLRKNCVPTTSCDPAPGSDEGPPNILLVLGAEGAYVDWLRMPWSRLCQGRLVVGLQQLPRPFLSQFCQLIESRVGVPTVPLTNGSTVRDGGLFLGNGGSPVAVRLSEAGALEVEERCDEAIPWQEGIQLWIRHLADLAGRRLSVLCLSAAHQLAPELIEHIMNREARLILPPRDCIMLPELQDGIQPYAHVMPHQVLVSSPENLLEVLAGNE
ncbi:MAG: response regulator [Syntrophobacteraceae bacterium]